MFDFDWLREILSTISKNKMRTFLTGFAVAWGILMLIVLLASGNGLKNGVMSNFSGRAHNTVTLWPGSTTMPYKGLASNRQIRFDYKDYDLIKNRIPEVEYVSGRIAQNRNISYQKEYGNWWLHGVTPDAAHINNIKVKAGNGRFLNEIDLKGKRKVIVINEDIRKVLFKDEEPFGKYVLAGNIMFQVVGVYEVEEGDNNPPAYIPFSTAQALYSGGYGFGRLDFTVLGLDTKEKNEAFIERLRGQMGQLHGFNPEDRSALYIWNSAEDFVEANMIFNGITMFVIVIGIASLMAGIVGVGNIMLITVKERTREIGIRKAIGAKPSSILRLIILESILITTVAGYIGIVIGIGITEMISAGLDSAPKDGPSIFLNPTVDLSTVIYATLFLIACGVLAGLIPAMKATRVSPIEAMRSE